MSQDSDFHINTRIEWKTKLYHRHALVTSPTFTLLGAEWYLVYSCHDEGFFGGCSYSAHLFPRRLEGKEKTLPTGGGSAADRSFLLSTPFEVEAYVVRNPTDVPVDRMKHRVTKRESVCIWDRELSKDGIFEGLHCIRDLGEVWLVCLFYGAEPTLVGTETGNPRPVRIENQSVQVSSEVPQDLEYLSEDFSHLLQEEILPDVKLECGNRTFQVHRSVLVARSEVFRAMFQNGMLESETGTVKIPGMDESVLEKLLKFIYSGKPGHISDGNTAVDLYEAAEQYALHSLREACSYIIRRSLTVDNCIDFLEVADSHCDRDLKASVLSFIVENPSVLKSEAWTAFTKEPSKLACEVFQAYVASTV